MREIKFRAWNGGMMRYLAEGDFIIEARGLLAPDEMGDKWKERDWPLMQFTGLKDKNGKEIYEGDIVRQYDQWEGEEIAELAPVERKSNVNWKWAGFGHLDVALNVRLYPSTEILGNIYENPELINKPLANSGSQENDAPQPVKKKGGSGLCGLDNNRNNC